MEKAERAVNAGAQVGIEGALEKMVGEGMVALGVAMEDRGVGAG